MSLFLVLVFSASRWPLHLVAARFPLCRQVRHVGARASKIAAYLRSVYKRLSLKQLPGWKYYFWNLISELVAWILPANYGKWWKP